MATVQWTDDLSVGIDLIDEQHKAMIKRLNDLAAAVELHQGPSSITGTLVFLRDYTDLHFTTEEKHMAETNYPGIDHQIEEHAAFRLALANLEADFQEEGATHEVAGYIDNLLINWFLDHIRTVDLEFGEFLHDKGITITT